MQKELLEQFNKETGIAKPVDTDLDYYQSQYITWLEQQVVKKNESLPDVSKSVNCAICGNELTDSEKEGSGNCCDLCWLSN